jgi:acetyl esterase/lipase
MRIRGRVAVLGALILALATAGPAQADLAPGLFAGGPPAGVVAQDNALTLPQGAPKGFALVIHGGSWFLTGPRSLASESATVRWLTGLGWAVYNVDYRPGWLSVVDVVAAYDHLRSLYPKAPKCAYGQSAGGQLAMLLAASRPSLRCVVSAGGITDLRAIPSANPLDALAERVFHRRLWEFSPVRVASYIRGTLLCAGSSFDRIVPERAQLAAIKVARPQTGVMLLPGAPTPGGPSFSHPPNFVHASVTPAARRRFRRAVVAMLTTAATAK